MNENDEAPKRKQSTLNFFSSKRPLDEVNNENLNNMNDKKTSSQGEKGVITNNKKIKKAQTVKAKAGPLNAIFKTS